MRKANLVVAAVAAIAALGSTAPVHASTHQWDAGAVQDFGPNLRNDCPRPEGVAVDPSGRLYTTSIPLAAGPANICVLSPSGKIIDRIPVQPGPAGFTNLAGALFEPSKGLYVVDVADDLLIHPTAQNGRLLRIDPETHKVKTLATGFAFPNGIAQDHDGNIFVSDSTPGRIYKVAADGSKKTLWSADPRLTSHHPFPFGANGIAFDRSQQHLYVSVTGDNRIIRVPVDEDGSAGPPDVFADGNAIDAVQHTTASLLTPDGIMFDATGHLYVCANTANEIQVLSHDGTRLIARYRGAGKNLLDQAASLVFRDETLYVTSLSLNDGGINSKVSALEVPFEGLPITLRDDD